MTDISANPCGLDGFAFLEFSAPHPEHIHQIFITMGFQPLARHIDADVTQYQQGDIQFFLNATEKSQAAEHAKIHGAGACAMGFRVKNAKVAFDYALQNGATAFHDAATHSHHLLAIEAIGGSVIYFVEPGQVPYAHHWQPLANDVHLPPSPQLFQIDHLTHNVQQGNMDKWADFYQKIFNFRQIRYYDIQGKMTGLVSRALSSPCNKIKIPLNESKDPNSQIEEFLHEYHGEGIQHVALSTENIYHSVRQLRNNGTKFLDVPDTYYEMVQDRVPWHHESLAELQQNRILIDGDKDPQGGLLLQIFTENIFGPVFFEIIQRKGNQGFGEGNFQALFEAIERDQIRRGTLETQ